MTAAPRELALAFAFAFAMAAASAAPAQEPSAEATSAGAPREERSHSIERLCRRQRSARADRRMVPRRALGLTAAIDEPVFSTGFAGCVPEDVVSIVRTCLPQVDFVDFAGTDLRTALFRATASEQRRIGELLAELERELLPEEALAIRVSDGTSRSAGATPPPRELRLALKDDSLSVATRDGCEAVVGPRAVAGDVALDLFLQATAPIEATSERDDGRTVAFVAWAGSCIVGRDEPERAEVKVATGAGTYDVAFELRAELTAAGRSNAPQRIGPFVGADGAPRWLEIWRGIGFGSREFVVEQPELARFATAAGWSDRVIVPPWDVRGSAVEESAEWRRLAALHRAHAASFDDLSTWNGCSDRLFLFAPARVLDRVRGDLEAWRAADPDWRIDGRLVDGETVAASFSAPLRLGRPAALFAGAASATRLEGIALRLRANRTGDETVELEVAAVAATRTLQLDEQRTWTLPLAGGRVECGGAAKFEFELRPERR